MWFHTEIYVILYKILVFCLYSLMTIGVLPIAGRLLTDSFIFHCYCSSSSYTLYSVVVDSDISVLPIVGRPATIKWYVNSFVFIYHQLSPVVILHYKIIFSKKKKFLSHHITFLASRSHLLLCIMLVLLTALSYSDLAKSWRGECGGIGIGPLCMYGPQ